MRTKLPSLLLGVVLSTSAVACGGAQPAARSAEDADYVDAQEQLIQFRTVLRELRADRFAAEAGPDLDRAESWIATAETRLAARDADDDGTIPVLVEAIKGQLVLVRSYYGRLVAETELEDTRKDYEHRVTRGRDNDDEEGER